MTFVHMTSNGFEGFEAGTSFALATQPVAEKDDEMERDYEWRTKRFFADLPSLKRSAASPANVMAKRIGARKVRAKSGGDFENRLAGRIISPFFSAISGSAVARGVSASKTRWASAFSPKASASTKTRPKLARQPLVLMVKAARFRLQRSSMTAY